MTSFISIDNVSKTYKGGLAALRNISLDIKRGEILALLGPNGAGKTTLISTICGIVTKSSGTITVNGHDTVTDFRAARALIGLVPQELHLSIFETPWDSVNFSRALYGKPANPKYIETLLKRLALWEKRDAKMVTLSGGMKRRVLIAKALAHEPKVLFLDEPTAGVDVELRGNMWQLVRELRDTGVTIILTTHYIEEAEEMADRVGVITRGELILVEEKHALMHKLGQKQLTLHLTAPLSAIPQRLADYRLELTGDGQTLSYSFDSHGGQGSIPRLLADLAAENISFTDLNTAQSSLEDIFMGLLKQ
ncbi:ABC transporter ATP-binding protein [Aestuariivirga sp.]|uniref:ABC transporter ATP-binding protein n=1 Tax=Aestuariivirga sp. TaxID=2650926 RepID=UPI003592F9BF